MMKDVYNKIVNANSGVYEEVFRKLWKVKSSLSSQMCGWRILYNKLLTRD